MRFLVLGCGALLLPLSSAAAPADRQFAPPVPARIVSPVPEHCSDELTHWTKREGESLRPRKLTELPQAEAYHSVYRTGPDGCPDPLLVGYQHRRER